MKWFNLFKPSIILHLLDYLLRPMQFIIEFFLEKANQNNEFMQEKA